MNICMVGHGMMGVWHSDALAARDDVVLHTVVGRREESTRAFAERYGYRKWSLDIEEALADPAVDAAVVASPSEQHPAHALACMRAGKPTLLEIPLGMSLADAERVVAAAGKAGVTLAMCHPMRFRRERDPLIERLRAGEEALRHVAGRFFIPRLENIGATGYRRSWTDNILWHHFCHFIDLATYLFGETPIRRVQSFMGEPHQRTGIPMECVVMVETEADQSFVVHGSYHASFRLYDKLLVTDRDTYLFDILESSLRTRDGVVALEDEKTNCTRVTNDFVEAVRDGRAPRAPAASALPAMRIIQEVQDAWDARHGARTLPGRPLA